MTHVQKSKGVAALKEVTECATNGVAGGAGEWQFLAVKCWFWSREVDRYIQCLHTSIAVTQVPHRGAQPRITHDFPTGLILLIVAPSVFLHPGIKFRRAT